MENKSDTLQNRFFSKVLLGSKEDCWLWLANKNNKGYGMIRAGGLAPKVLAHRVSYEIFKGKIPDGLVVMHSCDNPSCVNPSHLSAGTMLENTQDMIKKGRKVVGVNPDNKPPSFRGAAHPRAKISEETAREIKNSKERRSELIKRLGVTTSTVKSIKSGRTWKHL